LAFFSLTQE